MKCGLCGEHDTTPKDMAEDVALMMDHLRLFHPEHYGDGPERWPDGGVVLHDETIDPGDFGEADQ